MVKKFDEFLNENIILEHSTILSPKEIADRAEEIEYWINKAELTLKKEGKQSVRTLLNFIYDDKDNVNVMHKGALPKDMKEYLDLIEHAYYVSELWRNDKDCPFSEITIHCGIDAWGYAEIREK